MQLQYEEMNTRTAHQPWGHNIDLQNSIVDERLKLRRAFVVQNLHRNVSQTHDCVDGPYCDVRFPIIFFAIMNRCCCKDERVAFSKSFEKIVPPPSSVDDNNSNEDNRRPEISRNTNRPKEQKKLRDNAVKNNLKSQEKHVRLTNINL